MARNTPISVTLPAEAIEMIENGLVPFGLYGKHRATICTTLILDMLKTPSVQKNIEEGRRKGKTAAKD
jgi:hypothetical protein